MQWQEPARDVPSAHHDAGLRVSDRERERAVELLSEHVAEGRLSLEELDARTDGALAARTRGELAALTRDLPTRGSDDPPAAARTRMTRGALPDLSGQVVAFVAVNVLLVAVWAVSGGGYFWPAWPILGWGLALAEGGPCARRRAGRLPDGGPGTRLTRATGGAG